MYVEANARLVFVFWLVSVLYYQFLDVSVFVLYGVLTGFYIAASGGYASVVDSDVSLREIKQGLLSRTLGSRGGVG